MNRLDETGQASVEVLGTVPAVLLAALCLFQLLAAGYAIVMADNAVQAAAVAAANGDDPKAAAGRAVPGLPQKAVQVQRNGEQVEVTLRPPSPIKAVSKLLSVSSSATVRMP